MPGIEVEPSPDKDAQRLPPVLVIQSLRQGSSQVPRVGPPHTQSERTRAPFPTSAALARSQGCRCLAHARESRSYSPPARLASSSTRRCFGTVAPNTRFRSAACTRDRPRRDRIVAAFTRREVSWPRSREIRHGRDRGGRRDIDAQAASTPGLETARGWRPRGRGRRVRASSCLSFVPERVAATA